MALKFQRLTRPNMRKLEAGQRLQEHGITFERLDNGDGKFSVNLQVDGKRVHRHLGKESAGVTREQCEQFIEQLKTDARQGRLNLPKGRKLVLGFKEAAGKYLEKLEEEGGRNLTKKATHLRLYLIPFFKDTPLAKISSFDLERYKKSRLDSQSFRGGDRVSEEARQTGNRRGALLGKVTPGTVNRELATLSHLFTKAVSWGWLDHKPTEVKRLKEESGRIVYLTQEQIGRLLEEAKQDNCPDVYPFILIGLETSMRKMEILSIKLEHIDTHRRVIYIPKAKAGAREQPITASLAVFLQARLKETSTDQIWLFPSKTSKTGHVVNIEKPFRRVVEKSGLDPKEIVRHTLRHTAITHLVQAGVDLPTVKRISGHKTLQMVERYSHQNGDHIQAAMDRLQSRYKAEKQKA